MYFALKRISSLNFLFITIVGVLVYSNTFHVPYYFDDFPNIVENPAIRDLGQAARNAISSSRGLALLSFAANYSMGGLDVVGYHVVNLGIHIIASCLVLLILERIFGPTSRLPLLGALLFLVHPLQTQAVTYIVQRMTSLSGLFFFFSLYLYILAREEQVKNASKYAKKHLFYYVLAILSGALSVYTKQNAAILPVVLLLYEAYFPSAKQFCQFRKRFFYVLPFFAVPLWLSINEFLIPVFSGAGISEISNVQSLSSHHNPSMLNYFVTELSVVWLYIRLLFLPYGQVLDYSYPLVERLLEWKNIFAFVGIAGLLGTAFFIRRKAPLISFGIFWFFLSLSIESTLIPLDPAFEHRLYVPMFGFVVVMIGLLQIFFQSRWTNILLPLLVITFSLMTWKRNAEWNDPISFYEDNLRRTPWSERVNVALAVNYAASGRIAEARYYLEHASKINPDLYMVYMVLAEFYADRGDYGLAIETLKSGLQSNPGSANLYDLLGTLYERIGKYNFAIHHFEKSIKIDPLYCQPYLNLAGVYSRLGKYDIALAYYRKGIDLSDDRGTKHYYKGVMYYSENKLNDAKQEFLTACEINPYNGDALFNLAIVALELGETKFAEETLPRLKKLNVTLASELSIRISDALK